MDIKVREAHPGVHVLDIDGRLDLHTIHIFKDEVEPLKEDGDLILNFRDVASALGVLIRLSMDYEERKRRLVMVELSDLVLHVFELCGLTHRFPIYKTEGEGLSFLTDRDAAG